MYPVRLVTYETLCVVDEIVYISLRPLSWSFEGLNLLQT